MPWTVVWSQRIRVEGEDSLIIFPLSSMCQRTPGLIANLEYRGNIYRKMSKNTDWRGKTKPIMAQLPFLHSTNIPQA